MCGLTGVFDRRQNTGAKALETLTATMVECLRHRGPDGSGLWADETAGVAFGHRRLSVIDPSPAGNQPMASSCRRFVMVYNGEIYNANELRSELEPLGRKFKGHTDTEVILEGCAAWGVEETIPRLNGMFAIALWDRKERELTLIRDRLGIKPLYWGVIGPFFAFSSELKSLRECKCWTPILNRDALAAFMRHGYVPAPHTIYKGVYKLEPGCLLKVSASMEPEVQRYWDLSEIARNLERGQARFSHQEALDELESLLADAVKRRMIADVPLGAFLSGGIDSSTIVALMQAQSTTPIRTFSMGFNEDGYDEAKNARAVAHYLGTSHTEHYVSSQDALGVIPRLVDDYDEPFADSSQIPMHLVSKLARGSVTVALSGDGGDELFAGYDRYDHARKFQRYARFAPGPISKMVATGVRSVSPQNWDRIVAFLPRSARKRLTGDRIHRGAGLLALDKDVDRYRVQLSHWTDPELLVRGAREAHSPCWAKGYESSVSDPLSRMQLIDSITYLPDDILTKVDRASMSVGLEARVPLLDHRVVEFAWQLPRSMLQRGTSGKWPLRKVLGRHVPDELVDRPKMGFGIPIGRWLRGPLRDWAESLLARDRLLQDEIFDPDPIVQKWNQHLSCERDWQYPLWNVLIFQAWKERWRPDC